MHGRRSFEHAQTRILYLYTYRNHLKFEYGLRKGEACLKLEGRGGLSPSNQAITSDRGESWTTIGSIGVLSIFTSYLKVGVATVCQIIYSSDSRIF